MERETRSLKPIKMRITARKARGELCTSKPLAKGCQRCALACTNLYSRASTSVAQTYHSHAVAHHEYECLLIDGAWAGEEEVAEGKVKEGYGSNNGLGGYESHDGGLVSIQVEVGYRCRVVASQGRKEKQVKS